MFNRMIRSCVLALIAIWGMSAGAETVDVPTKVEAPLPGDTPAAAEPTRAPRPAAHNRTARKHGKSAGHSSGRNDSVREAKKSKSSAKSSAKSSKSSAATTRHNRNLSKKR